MGPTDLARLADGAVVATVVVVVVDDGGGAAEGAMRARLEVSVVVVEVVVVVVTVVSMTATLMSLDVERPLCSRLSSLPCLLIPLTTPFVGWRDDM
jgi:hypothetical protein